MNEYTHKNGVTIRRLPIGVFEATTTEEPGEVFRSPDGVHWCWDDGDEMTVYTMELRAAWFAWAGQDDGLIEVPEPEPVTYTGPIKDWPLGLFVLPGSGQQIIHTGDGRGVSISNGSSSVEINMFVVRDWIRVGDFDPSVLFESGGAK